LDKKPECGDDVVIEFQILLWTLWLNCLKLKLIVDDDYVKMVV